MPDSQQELMFQVGLINDDDLHFTLEGKKEDMDYWFVTWSQISAEVNRNDDEEAKERAQNEGGLSLAAPFAESEATGNTERKKGSAIWQYFDKVEDCFTSGVCVQAPLLARASNSRSELRPSYACLRSGPRARTSM